MAVSQYSKKLDHSILSITLLCSDFCYQKLKNYTLFSIFLDSEYVWKNNISDNEAEDSLAFNIMKKYIFRSDLSNNLTGDF